MQKLKAILAKLKTLAAWKLAAIAGLFAGVGFKTLDAVIEGQITVDQGKKVFEFFLPFLGL